MDGGNGAGRASGHRCVAQSLHVNAPVLKELHMTTATTYSPTQLAALIDHTLLRADATRAQFAQLCAEAREYGFAMVAINPYPVALARELLAGSPVRVGAAIGFPLGQIGVEDKIAETDRAIQAGAQEIDYVVNLTELIEGNTAYVEREMTGIVRLCQANAVTSKVIFENCYLSNQQKQTLARIALSVGPDYIKTSTGFGTSGATLEDVALMKGIVGDAIKVKAAGGIRTLEQAAAYLDLGVERIGTTAGVRIVDALRSQHNTAVQSGPDRLADSQRRHT
jgi:deoxyribose-phosphate aldolase